MNSVANSLLLIISASTATLTSSYSSTLYTETYLAPAISLYPGQIEITDPDTYGDLDWPKQPIAIRSFTSNVVDENGIPVPLYDLYVHHYLLYINSGKYSAGWCQLYNIFGIGAEMRGSIVKFPDPYAVILDGNETWTATIHFIRTDTVPNIDHQKCIECHCSDGTPNNPDGDMSCCPTNEYCWGMNANKSSTQKTYYLQYTIEYTNITNDLIPITIFNFDVTAMNNFDCRVQYQVPEYTVINNSLNIWNNISTVPQDTNIVLIASHQHIGGLNYSIQHWRNNKYIDTICDSRMIYGNGTEAGNENGYLVKIPMCEFTNDNPYKVQKGDQLVATSTYTERHITGGGDYHEGVMGLFFYWGERTGPSDCETKLKELCGDPLPASSNDCFQCAEDNILQLENANCGGFDYNWRVLDFLCLTDNGVKTPYPINYTQTYINQNDGKSGNKNWKNNQFLESSYVYKRKQKKYANFGKM